MTFDEETGLCSGTFKNMNHLFGFTEDDPFCVLKCEE